MANTYTQIHLQIVIVVKYRKALIRALWKERLHQYISGIVRNNEHKMLCINSVPDHLHMLIGFRPHQSLADLMQKIKGDSTNWINVQKLTPQKFQWQVGYGAFSYTKSQVSTVANYIEKQEQHHMSKTFMEEYLEFLEEYEVDYDSRYIFVPPE
jgi:REP element-mobilizing transposase RayT